MTDIVLDPRVHINMGKILVNSVVCRYETDDIQIWEIDMKTKYAAVLTYGEGPDFESDKHLVMIDFYNDGNAIKTNDEADLFYTAVVIEVPSDTWGVIGYTGGRYTFTVVVFDRTKYKNIDEIEM